MTPTEIVDCIVRMHNSSNAALVTAMGWLGDKLSQPDSAYLYARDAFHEAKRLLAWCEAANVGDMHWLTETEEMAIDAMERAEAAEAEVAKLRETLDEFIEREYARSENRPLANGEYPHLLICSADRRKPLASSGCVCDPRLKAAEAEVARLTNKLNTDSQHFELECRKAQIEQLEAEVVRLRAENEEGFAVLRSGVSLLEHQLAEAQRDLAEERQRANEMTTLARQREENLIALATERAKREALRVAVEALYFGAHWHSDRLSADEEARLWTTVRDAAGIPSGRTAERLGPELARRCGTCADWQANWPFLEVKPTSRGQCVSATSACGDAIWPADHGCPHYRQKEKK